MERLLRSCGVGLILGFALASGSAKAQSYNFGNIMPADIPGELVVVTTDFSVDTIFNGGVPFEGHYSFDLVDPGTPGVTVSVLFEVENASDAQAVVPLTVKFYRHEGSGDTLLALGIDGTVTFTHLLATSPTAEGQYLLTIAGTAPAELTAGYFGKLTVMAVPEPSTTALLLAGLGLLGSAFRSVRRPQGLALRHR